MIYMFDFSDARFSIHPYTFYKNRRAIYVPFPEKDKSIPIYPITPFCKIILHGHCTSGYPFLKSTSYLSGSKIVVELATAGAIAKWICTSFTDPPIPSRPRLGPKIQLLACRAATSRGEYNPAISPPERSLPTRVITITDGERDVPEDTGEPFAKRLFEELKKRGLICDIIAYDDITTHTHTYEFCVDGKKITYPIVSKRFNPETGVISYERVGDPEKPPKDTMTKKILREMYPKTRSKRDAKYIFGEREGTYYSENYAEWKERYRENPYSYWIIRLSDPSLFRLSKLEILESLRKFILLPYCGESSCYSQLSSVFNLIEGGEGVFQWERIIDLLRKSSVIARFERKINLAEILYKWFTLLMFYPDESESVRRSGGGY